MRYMIKYKKDGNPCTEYTRDERLQAAVLAALQRVRTGEISQLHIFDDLHQRVPLSRILGPSPAFHD